MGCNRRHAPAVARSRDWHLGQARLAIGHALNGARFALRMVGSPDGVPSLRTLQDVTRSVEMQARAARNALERAAPVDGDLYRVVHDAAWNLSYLMVCIDASDAGPGADAYLPEIPRFHFKCAVRRLRTARSLMRGSDG